MLGQTAARCVAPSVSAVHRWPRLLLVLVGLTTSFTVLSVSTQQEAAQALGWDPATIKPITLTASAAATFLSPGGPGILTSIVPVGTAAVAPAVASAAVPLAVAAAGLAIGYGVGTAGRWAWRGLTGEPVEDNPDPGFGDPPAGQNNGPGVDTNLGYTGRNGTVPAGQYGAGATGWIFITGPVGLNLTLQLHNSSGTSQGGHSDCGPSTMGPSTGDYCNGAPYYNPIGWRWLINGTNTVVAQYGSMTTLNSIYGVKTESTGEGNTSGGVEPGTTVLTVTPTSNCSGGGTAAGASISFTANTPSSLLPIMPGGGTCPAGQVRIGTSYPTTRAPAGGETGAQAVESVIGTLGTAVIPDAYPECQATATKVCTLTLLQIAPGVSGQTVTCNYTTACVGWSTQAKPTGVLQTQLKADGTTQTVKAHQDNLGRHYECRYGPYLIPTLECTTVPTEPPPAPPTPDDGGDCSLSDFGWNPITWVYVPVKCALVWAFVPDTDALSAQMAQLAEAWDTSPPGVLFGAIGGLVEPLGGFSGAAQGDCNGPRFTFHFLGPDVGFNPFFACDGIPEKASDTLLAMETFLVYTGGLFLGIRLVSRQLGLFSPEDL